MPPSTASRNVQSAPIGGRMAPVLAILIAFAIPGPILVGVCLYCFVSGDVDLSNFLGPLVLFGLHAVGFTILGVIAYRIIRKMTRAPARSCTGFRDPGHSLRHLYGLILVHYVRRCDDVLTVEIGRDDRIDPAEYRSVARQCNVSCGASVPYIPKLTSVHTILPRRL